MNALRIKCQHFMNRFGSFTAFKTYSLFFTGLNLQSQFNLENVTVFNTNEHESTLGQKVKIPMSFFTDSAVNIHDCLHTKCLGL